MKADLMLDTCIIIYMAKEDPRANLYRDELRGKDIAVSFVTVAELLYGAYRSGNVEKNLEFWANILGYMSVIYPDYETCRMFSELKAKRSRMGRMLDDADLWIAALAIRYGITLVSHNKKHFGTIDGLQLVAKTDDDMVASTME